MSEKGTNDDPWVLKTPPGSSEYQMWRDEEADPPTLVCQVGKTQLGYQLRCIEDLHAMLTKAGDWVPLGAADEQKPAAEGHRGGLGALARQPGGRVVRDQEGAPGAVRYVRAAAARGARAGRGRTQRATTG
jgi:hypothetical protein